MATLSSRVDRKTIIYSHFSRVVFAGVNTCKILQETLESHRLMTVTFTFTANELLNYLYLRLVNRHHIPDDRAPVSSRSQAFFVGAPFF